MAKKKQYEFKLGELKWAKEKSARRARNDLYEVRQIELRKRGLLF